MPRTYSHVPTPAEKLIARLQEELYSARMTILDLMPSNVQKILLGYHRCETSKVTHLWTHEVIETLVELAEPLPNAAHGYTPTRAYCPLCQRGSSASYADGFTLPEGLRRHLTGWGNVQQCNVMAATMALARDSWRSRFEAVDAAEAAQARAQKEQRKRTEVQYRLGPNEEPKLIDEGLWGKEPRNSTELAWAEQRLSTLGFQVTTEEGVKSYTQSGKDFIVYADLRAKGRLDFRVYRSPPPKRSGNKHSPFTMQDTWKHDLVTKYKKHLSSALESRSR